MQEQIEADKAKAEQEHQIRDIFDMKSNEEVKKDVHGMPHAPTDRA